MIQKLFVDAPTQEQRREFFLVAEIAMRRDIISPVDKLSLCMDLETAHKATPLDLERLLAADDGNFMHDIEGIRTNLNRRTGELENLFLPRFAVNQ